MLITVNHCESQLNSENEPNTKYWENAELDLQDAHLVCIIDNQDILRWIVVASREALKWFLENNHHGYEIESFYQLTADPYQKTRLKVREVKAWQSGIVTVADDGEKCCHLFSSQPVAR